MLYNFPALYPLSTSSGGGVAVHCRFSSSGCPYRLPSMEFHEERRCRFRPTRCPSLTCPDKPPYARLMEHIQVPKGNFRLEKISVAQVNANFLYRWHHT